MSNDDPWMYALIYMRNDVHRIFTKYICIFVLSILFHLYMYVCGYRWIYMRNDDPWKSFIYAKVTFLEKFYISS